MKSPYVRSEYVSQNKDDAYASSGERSKSCFEREIRELKAERDRLASEVARLRGALREIHKLLQNPNRNIMLGAIEDIARRALEW